MEDARRAIGARFASSPRAEPMLLEQRLHVTAIHADIFRELGHSEVRLLQAFLQIAPLGFIASLALGIVE